VRYDDRPTDDESDVERVVELLVGDALGDALADMVRDAIVAAQDERRYETEQLFRLARQRTVFVCARIEIEETADAEMTACEDLLVHLTPVGIEFFDVRRHVRYFSVRRR